MSSWHWYFNHFQFHYWALENQTMVNMKLTPLPHKAHNKSADGQRPTVHTQGSSVRHLHTEDTYTAQWSNLLWKIIAQILSVKTLYQQLQMWPLIDAFNTKSLLLTANFHCVCVCVHVSLPPLFSSPNIEYYDSFFCILEKHFLRCRALSDKAGTFQEADGGSPSLEQLGIGDHLECLTPSFGSKTELLSCVIFWALFSFPLSHCHSENHMGKGSCQEGASVG